MQVASTTMFSIEFFSSEYPVACLCMLGHPAACYEFDGPSVVWRLFGSLCRGSSIGASVQSSDGRRTKRGCKQLVGGSVFLPVGAECASIFRTLMNVLEKSGT